MNIALGLGSSRSVDGNGKLRGQGYCPQPVLGGGPSRCGFHDTNPFATSKMKRWHGLRRSLARQALDLTDWNGIDCGGSVRLLNA